VCIGLTQAPRAMMTAESLETGVIRRLTVVTIRVEFGS